MASDIEIARAAKLRPIADVAAGIGLAPADLDPYGHHIAKLATTSGAARGKLILVTAINPTPAGEGKTTTTIGLGDALNHIGRSAVIALREPSLGPVFGRKGGATGGGQSQVLPMDRINLHFTGDFHAITAAHNLLAALIDNALHFRLPTATGLPLDARHIQWRRVMDMNDRALRQIAVGMGPGNAPAREAGFDITVASEVMAILCLADDFDDLRLRLARIRIGRDEAGTPVTAGDIGATGAMMALLIDAIRPNLVQTIAGSAAFVHGGPFANIAHGCNSVVATRAALAHADFAVTEAGFGADLGAEKFCDIKCRSSGLRPAVAVLVATVRALKYHGGAPLATLAAEHPAALDAGLASLTRHIENLRLFGIPVVVAINEFSSDTAAEHAAVLSHCRETLGVAAHICRHWSQGAAGAADLAHSVAALADADTADFCLLYPDAMPLADKLRTVAQQIYRAADISLSPAAARQLRQFTDQGFGGLPVCIAKTPYSFTADEHVKGTATGFILPIREARLSAGAGFVVALAGDINTMPGLPRVPAALGMDVDAEGNITGLD
ncbi:formate--tetrahydrofolate ligase [Polymorphobacter fuscus]|uniref:Formate--tetrahydrofolate ligase n=1 Tax=Sandarakinorhabdus fusca TaxID=1439888 RepID=A0A7C9KVT4_9SPHN|nr:formate--tetrahydrofolate ligase [Polymorphobacter fuscus]KAB7648612.1 formate--tetrahydrofolate ligase [Polymorphobacter fuscus]MQT16162.1 formate--tetrahydrofolate ligase [Polymorphobacter fuscus]NJC07559.1 formate--tetrahydrofolate ligase [Polymorphobacter fuscus]